MGQRSLVGKLYKNAVPAGEANWIGGRSQGNKGDATGLRVSILKHQLAAGIHKTRWYRAA
jgi:hypothetical protein